MRVLLIGRALRGLVNAGDFTRGVVVWVGGSTHVSMDVGSGWLAELWPVRERWSENEIFCSREGDV